MRNSLVSPPYVLGCEKPSQKIIIGRKEQETKMKRKNGKSKKKEQKYKWDLKEINYF